MTVIVKVWAALVSSPPLARPPLSWSWIVIVALPTPAAAGVNVSVPVGLTAGWTAKSALLVLFVTENATVWADSFAGPSLIAVAQPGIECAPEFSKTVWFAALGERRRVVDRGDGDRERLPARCRPSSRRRCRGRGA